MKKIFALIVVAALALAAGCGAELSEVTRPVLVQDATGKWVPVYDNKGNILTQTEKMPPEQAWGYHQVEMAKLDRPVAVAEFPNGGTVPAGFTLKVWGNNGRHLIRDYEGQFVKGLKVVGPGALAAATGAFGMYTQYRLATDLAGVARAQFTNSFNSEGDGSLAQYATYGNTSGGSWAPNAGWSQDNRTEQNPVTTTTTSN